MIKKDKKAPKYHDTWNRDTKQVERKPGSGITWDGKSLKVLAVTAIAGLGLAIGNEVIDTPPEHYEGKVVAKNYDDPDTWTDHGLIGPIGMNTTRHDPEHRQIQVELNDSDMAYTIEVNEKQFDKLDIGDSVHVDKDIITPENNG